LGMVTYGLPVVYTLYINQIKYSENRFSLISGESIPIRVRL